jgi:hypothetical protein
MKAKIDPQILRAIQARNVAINVAETMSYEPVFDGRIEHDKIVAANDSLLNQAYLSQPLTNFAVGFRDSADLEAELEFLAPRVEVPRRFSYRKFDNAEEFHSETTDDERPIRGAFKQVEYTATEVEAKTTNRGLMIAVDLDEVADQSAWQEKYTAKLLRRLRRNAVRRAAALLSGGATNTAKTWDTTAGKDPDQDVIADLITAAGASGVRPNRIAYGETAWSKRGLAHRAQDKAGGFASASLTAEQLAGLLGVEGVLRSMARYTSSASARTEVVSNLVLMFNAISGADTEDSSNVKRFVSPVEGGGDVRVYVQQVNAKIFTITVEHYELIKLTSTLGIRKFTVS